MPEFSAESKNNINHTTIVMRRTRCNESAAVDAGDEAGSSVSCKDGQTSKYKVFWEPPPDPNGPVLLFEIVYRRADQPNTDENVRLSSFLPVS